LEHNRKHDLVEHENNMDVLDDNFQNKDDIPMILMLYLDRYRLREMNDWLVVD